MNPLIEKLEGKWRRCAGKESNFSILDFSTGDPVDDGHIHKWEATLAPIFDGLSFENSEN